MRAFMRLLNQELCSKQICIRLNVTDISRATPLQHASLYVLKRKGNYSISAALTTVRYAPGQFLSLNFCRECPYNRIS